MPGPGGGGHGGGGGRGGSFGGGRGDSFGGGGRGGSFGGGFHGGPRPPHPGGFHGGPRPPHPGGWGMPMGGWGRRRYVGGGGCLGGLISALLTPFIVIMVLSVMLFSMCQNGVDVTVNNGYDETVFQDYANDQYALHFSDSADYEDNLLIVVLTTEDYYEYYYMAWVGDHIVPDINNMMGNNSTELGWVMNSCINETNYKYSLDSNLAQVMQTMAQKAADLGLESSFTCDTIHDTIKAEFVNNTELPLTQSTLEEGLKAFADVTGIPVVLVVEDAADVFGSNTTSVSSETFTQGAAIVALVIVGVIAVIVIAIRKKKSRDETKDSRYREFDDQY